MPKVSERKIRHLEHFGRAPNATGLGEHSIEPLDTDNLRPPRCALFAAGDEIKRSAQSVSATDTYTEEQVGILCNPHLLLHRPKANDKVRWAKVSDSAEDIFVPLLIRDASRERR